MPTRVHIHVKGATKVSTVNNGDSVELNKKSHELEIKDATGQLLGRFKTSMVSGWWIESEPNDLKNLSPQDLERFIAEIDKHGMVALDDDKKEPKKAN